MHQRDLFTQLGLDQISDDEKLNISEDLGEVALNRIANRIGAILTDGQAAEFENLLKTDEKAAYELLAKYIPDYQVIAAEEIGQLRDEVVDTQSEIMKKLKENN